MEARTHWDRIYERRASDQLGWYQAHLRISLELIGQLHLQRSSPIIDVGGGNSTLVDDLVDRGYTNITVLDISPTALARARARLGPRAERVHWVEADLLRAELPPHYYALWHDRALFHFLVKETERAAYLARLIASLAPAGRAVIATFAPDGPTECSGLLTQRHGPQDIVRVFGEGFEIVASLYEDHSMPSGAHRRFAYSLLKARLQDAYRL